MFERLHKSLLVLVLLVSCGLAWTAVADDASLAAGDFDEPSSGSLPSLERLETLARRGSVEAQFLLASRYFHAADRRQRDLDKALYWFERAALGGHLRSQYLLAFLYEAGLGVPADLPRARYWYRRAAEGGDGPAQLWLARELLAQGRMQRAAYWLGQAAAQGEVEAQYELALFYEAGRGVPASPSLAQAWMERAARAGLAAAQLRLGGYLLDGYAGRQDYYEAMEWFFKAAAQGSAEAQYNLGMMYAYGIGVLYNPKRAYRWLRRAARSGHPKARREIEVLWQRTAQRKRRIPLPELRRAPRHLAG